MSSQVFIQSQNEHIKYTYSDEILNIDGESMSEKDTERLKMAGVTENQAMVPTVMRLLERERGDRCYIFYGS